ncbi:hypothetical protein MHM95_06645 [Pseudoalteromonas sp. CnMc7-15]|uniref:hypothetical protein n=1 Tax=unclassified Pseudoalteromonas TaxID=194690 RepID=UPI001EF4A3D2|nr:hypothetical protein [Pseudoalteromonas sp. CnMc7-15]MCG7565962.1 hypothetical protein [Pseudoalteromonas sp. CnMc7-15]
MRIWKSLSVTLIVASSLFISSQSLAALTEAYGCKSCYFEEAKQIATLEAPRNNCSIYENGSPATYCEPVRKEIIVLSQNDESIYKFIVNTAIDSYDRPTVSVVSGLITPTERLAAYDYFKFQNDFESVMLGLNQSSSFKLSENIFQYNESSSFDKVFSEATSSSCLEHPTNFFRGNAQKREVKMELAASLNEFASGQTWEEIKHQAIVGGGGVSISRSGAGINVSLKYLEENYSASKFYDFANYLTFDMSVKTSIVNGDSVQIFADFSLNKRLSKIDGISVNDLFQPDNGEFRLDTSKMSECWDEFIRDSAEDVTNYEGPGTGTGTEQDPFVGGSGWPQDSFCLYKAETNICSNDEEGNQQCWTSTISWIDTCGRF